MYQFKKRGNKKERLYGYFFIIPAILFMLIFIAFPIIYNFLISFQNMTADTLVHSNREWLGLKNYKMLFSTPLLGKALTNTLVFTICSLIVQFSIGFALALFFVKDFYLAKPLRGFMLVAYMMPIVITGMAFKFLFAGEMGAVNTILLDIGIISEPILWLTRPITAMVSVIIANIWKAIPFNMLLLTAGLLSIPKDIYEGAAIDGANILQRFFYITLPMMKSTIVAVLLLGFVYTFKVFDLVFTMTSGGPANATEMMSTYSYRLAFSHYKFSEAAAVANILFFCLLGVSLIYLKLINKEEEI